LYKKTTLDNGLRVLSYNIPQANSFALGLFVNSGSREDFQNHEGIAHFLEHSVFRRTKGKTSKKISQEFENLGAYTNAFTTKETICFYVRALPDNFQKIIKLLYDITINPIFLDKDIDKERKIINEELKSYYDDPEELILDYSDEIIFRNSNLSHPIIGTEQSLLNINKDELERFHQLHLNAKNLIISIVSNIEHDKIIDIINKIFKLKNNSIFNNNRSISTYKPENLIVEKDYAQNHFLFSTRSCKFSDNEKYALSALSFLLGEGNSSILNYSLREKFGLVYSVYSNLQFYSDTGVFSIYAGSENKNIDRIKSIIENEFYKLSQKQFSEKELNLAKQQLKASAIMSIENFSDLMQDIAKNEMMNQQYLNTNEIFNKIDEISIDLLNELVERYMKNDIWSKIIFKIT